MARGLVRFRARTVARKVALTPAQRFVALFALSLALLLLTSCESTTSPEPIVALGDAVAFGIWTPAGTDTCSKAIHDSYSTVGPDQLRYPTWHPPVDPVTGCTFGHEHGRDPSGSDLYDLVGDIPFG